MYSEAVYVMSPYLGEQAWWVCGVVLFAVICVVGGIVGNLAYDLDDLMEPAWVAYIVIFCATLLVFGDVLPDSYDEVFKWKN